LLGGEGPSFGFAACRQQLLWTLYLLPSTNLAAFSELTQRGSHKLVTGLMLSSSSCRAAPLACRMFDNEPRLRCLKHG
jgi:hypothetical protein